MRMRPLLGALLVVLGLALPASAKTHKPKKIKSAHAKTYKYKARKLKLPKANRRAGKQRARHAALVAQEGLIRA